MSERKQDSYVYCLVHVETNRTFYVGRGTKQNGKCTRFVNHLWQAGKGSMYPVHRKIRSLQENNQHIKCEIRSENLTEGEAMNLEVVLIQAYGLDNLTNTSPGGDDMAWLNKKAVGVAANLRRERRRKSLEQIENHRQGSHKKIVFLRNVETKEITQYDSLQVAADALGVDKNAVWQAVAKGYRVKGHVASYSLETLSMDRVDHWRNQHMESTKTVNDFSDLF